MSTTQSKVRSIHVVSTGRAGVHPEHIYGTRKPTLWWVFRSKQWVDIPINVYVIEHDDGLVLFDTGADPAVALDPDYWPDPITRFINRHVFRFDISPDDDLGTQLRQAGRDPGDVTTAVLSHLHFDHAGGIRHIPDAELLVASEAWEHMLGPHPERKAVLRRDLAVPGARWKLLDFQPTDDPALAPFTEAYDVLGDGSMVVIPTPGHMPGSVSMLVRRDGAAPVLLIGDLTYSEELLNRDQVAGIGAEEVLLRSYAKVRALKEHTPGLVIVASHDTTAADKLADAEGATAGQH